MGIFSAKPARVMALAALLGITLALIFSRQSSMAGADGGITIWELCASNHGCLTDGKGAHPDWIELTNTGEEAVNLKGFTLGDSKRKLDLAVLPEYVAARGVFGAVRFRRRGMGRPLLPRALSPFRPGRVPKPG